MEPLSIAILAVAALTAITLVLLLVHCEPTVTLSPRRHEDASGNREAMPEAHAPAPPDYLEE